MAQDYLNRYRAEAAKPRRAAVDSATVIRIGDMLWLDTDDAKPAYAFTWDTNLATTQAAFKALFLGIAAEESLAGATVDILFNTVGIHEMKCASATFEIGVLLAPAKHASEDKLLNDTVVDVTATEAIAKVTQREAVAVTTVFEEFFSEIMKPTT